MFASLPLFLLNNLLDQYTVVDEIKGIFSHF